MKIYTDGSCTKNGKPDARGGCGVYFGLDDPRNISCSLDELQKKYNLIGINSNNRAELMAICVASDFANTNDILVTDSKYSINSLTVWLNKWKKNNMMGTNRKPVLNQDLILLIDKKLSEKNLRLEYVPAHTGHSDPDSLGNAGADFLATNATSEQ